MSDKLYLRTDHTDVPDAFQVSMKLVYDAHSELLRRLFGELPSKEAVGSLVVTREHYTEVMKQVQKDYGLVEGNPDLVLFVFEQLSRSPKFADEEIEEGDEQ